MIEVYKTLGVSTSHRKPPLRSTDGAPFAEEQDEAEDREAAAASAAPGASRPRRFSAWLAELHLQLRTEGGTPARSAVAFGVGAFIGCLPLYGLHLVICVLLARLLRVSRIKTYLGANISNPVVAPFLLYLEYGVGHWLFEQRWPDLSWPQFETAGALSIGRDLVAGSLVVGALSGVLLATVTYRIAKRWRAAPFEERLREATARRYLELGIFDWEFVRGKLRYDPMYRAILRSEILPQEGRLIDIGCGRGILLALLDTARGLADSLPSGAGWRPPSRRLHLAGIELQPKIAAAAEQALGRAAEITVASATDEALPPAQAIFLLDVLHYLPAAEQEQLVERVATALAPGGVLVVREANADQGVSFFLTRVAERFCALARGHLRQHFHYRGVGEWLRLLAGCGLVVEEQPMSAGTPYANRLIEARKPETTDENDRLPRV